MVLDLPSTDSCYFCRVIAGAEARWSVWDEDELTLTMLNGRQFETGQSIVIPKRHAPTILELQEDELCAVMTAARRASEVMMETYDPIGILLYQNNGVGSGQEVPHFHLHVVPRQGGSDWGFGPPHLAELDRRASDPRFAHDADTPEKLETARRLKRNRVNRARPA